MFIDGDEGSVRLHFRDLLTMLRRHGQALRGALHAA